MTCNATSTACGCDPGASLFGGLLDRRVNVERQSVTADAGGAVVRNAAWTKVAQNVPAVIFPARASVMNAYARRDMVVDYQIITTTDLEKVIGGEGVKLTDRIVDLGNKNYYYLVQGVERTVHALFPFASYVMNCQRLVYS